MLFNHVLFQSQAIQVSTNHMEIKLISSLSFYLKLLIPNIRNKKIQQTEHTHYTLYFIHITKMYYFSEILTNATKKKKNNKIECIYKYINIYTINNIIVRRFIFNSFQMAFYFVISTFQDVFRCLKANNKTERKLL